MVACELESGDVALAAIPIRKMTIGIAQTLLLMTDWRIAMPKRTNLAEAHLRDHPFEAGALDGARRRATEIVVDHLDLRPAKRRQSIPHGILQRAALPVVQYLMGR